MPIHDAEHNKDDSKTLSDAAHEDGKSLALAVGGIGFLALAGAVTLHILPDDKPGQFNHLVTQTSLIKTFSSEGKQFPVRDVPDTTVKGALKSKMGWVHPTKDGGKAWMKLVYTDVKLSDCTTEESIIKGSTPSPMYTINNVTAGAKIKNSFEYIDGDNNVVDCKTATIGSFDKPQSPQHWGSIGDVLRNFNSEPDEVGLIFPAG